MLYKRHTKYMRRPKSARNIFKSYIRHRNAMQKVLKQQQERKVWLKTESDLTGHCPKENMQK